MRKGIIYVYFNRAKYEKEGIEKYYVGQTVGTMEQRAGKDGKNYSWKDPNCNSKFARSIRKWGWDAFEGRVLEEVYEEDLNELEKLYIEQFDSYKNGYNSTLGGEGSSGYVPSKNTLKLLSDISKKNWKKEEFRNKTIEAQKKAQNNPETIKKKVEAFKNTLKNPEVKKKFKDSKSGGKNGRAKKCKCVEIGLYFSYSGEAEEFLEKNMNIIEHNLRKKCDGKTLIGIYKNTKLHFEHCSDFEYYTFNSILTNEEIFENFEGNEGTELEFYYNNKGTKRPCYCNELDLYFESCSDAVTFLEEKLNTRVGVISGVCNKNGYTGKLLNEKKCFWRYVNENDINDLKKYEYCIINKEKLYKEAEDKYKIYDFYISNKNNTYSVPCYCYELDMYFESYKSAATYCKNVLNISLGSIKNCVLGIASYSGKYNGKKLHWRKIKLNDREDVYKYNEYMLSHM